MNVTRREGPQIWLAGDPAEIKDLLPFGVAGIITNTIVLKDLTERDGQLIDVLKQHLDITDKTIVTVFSLSQAVLVAAAGASWIAPFVGPTHAFGKDAIAFVSEIVNAFRDRPDAPGVIGGIVRNPASAYLAYAAGADAVVTFPAVYWEMLEHPGTVEVDGDTIDDFMYAAEAAYTLSDQVMIKVPTKRVGIQAHGRLRDLGVRTMATTVFSLSQAVLVAAAGASWIAPFVGPTHAFGKDAIAFVSEIVNAFRDRPDAPGVIGGIVRNPASAYLAYAAGADAVVTFPAVYWEMLEHPGTTEWNDTFKGKWDDMETAGVLDGFVRSKTPAGVP
jgi:transaldolase